MRDLMLHQAAVVLLDDGQAVLAGERLELRLLEHEGINVRVQLLSLGLLEGHFAEVDELPENLLDLVLENDHLAREHLAIWSVLGQEVV